MRTGSRKYVLSERAGWVRLSIVVWLVLVVEFVAQSVTAHGAIMGKTQEGLATGNHCIQPGTIAQPNLASELRETKEYTYGEWINHYNILRTLENMYGLDPLGVSAGAQPITDVWRQCVPSSTTQC